MTFSFSLFILKEKNMPAKSKAQQRFFGMVDAYKKGELSDASPEVKNAAKSMSTKKVKDFAKTNHRGLPNRVHKKKKLKESDIRKIVESVLKRILNDE